MSDRPTPETDDEALSMDLYCDDAWATVYIKRGGWVVYGDFVLGDFARKLERERDEAGDLLASEKITRNHIIQRGIEMQKELTEAREALRSVLELAEDIPDEALDAWKNYFHTILEAAK